MAAIESVIRMGSDIVEIDVQRTKDGVLILMHYETWIGVRPVAGE